MQKIIVGREYSDVVSKLVRESKHSIKILMYAWLWYPNSHGTKIQKFNNEIIQANLRGVDVQALVNGGYICDALKQLKVNIKRVNTSKLMHAKMIIVDNKYLILGSHNLTRNAFDLNHEISLLTDDLDVIVSCNKFFDSMFI